MDSVQFRRAPQRLGTDPPVRKYGSSTVLITSLRPRHNSSGFGRSYAGVGTDEKAEPLSQTSSCSHLALPKLGGLQPLRLHRFIAATARELPLYRMPPTPRGDIPDCLSSPLMCPCFTRH